MNTIAILTKLFPKSIATIQQQAINDYRKSNEDNYPWPESDHNDDRAQAFDNNACRPYLCPRKRPDCRDRHT